MSDADGRDPWWPGFEAALRSSDPTMDLSAAVKALRLDGASRVDLEASLSEFRKLLLSESRDADDDVVLEVLDFLVGWCHPRLRIE